ncbi:MAG: exo-alpha-sialidase [Planctomycetes bacterium]|nr:exo-alpha-sialidase [Planctomycetota bacterium]
MAIQLEEANMVGRICIMVLIMFSAAAASAQTVSSASLRIVSRSVGKDTPPLHGAIYAELTDDRLLGAGLSRVSQDNGRTWTPFTPTPNFRAGLPYGYRREPVTSALDPATGRLITIVNALDTPGLDPKIVEPPIAQETYYLRYRVSADGGRTWLFDEPMVQAGDFTAQHPFEGIWVGKNSIYLGDQGCIPIITRTGRVLVPAQTTPLGPDGKLWNPAGGWTYTDALALIGEWTDGSRLKWRASQRVQGDPTRSSRGMIEPTLAQFPDGRILMVMRGSNGGKADPKCEWPSYRWFSVSTDDGETWTKPAPCTYDDGQPFFSPSSMSTLLRHSSGRVFWVGNVSPTNCQGNSPRWPVVMGEFDPKSLTLLRDSVLTVDTEQPEDKSQGRLDLCHFAVLEDRETREIILTYPRAHNAYKSYEWATVRLAVPPR